MYGLSVCSGIGGLEMGLQLAIPNYRCLAYVEREAYAAAILIKRMAEGYLDSAPIWSDLRTFTGEIVSPFVDKVDILSSGFPCQPWSHAGHRKGTEDSRWLWPDISRIICEIRPKLVFLENVPGILRSGMSHVLGALAELGFNAEWGMYSAAKAGAPHIRKRVFILAYSNSGRLEGREEEQEGEQIIIPDGPDVADPEKLPLGSGLCQNVEDQVRRRRSCNGRKQREICDHDGLNENRGGHEHTEVCRERPTQTSGDWWASEPNMGRVAHGVSCGVDRLRALGNAVVPEVARIAFLDLYGRITE